MTYPVVLNENDTSAFVPTLSPTSQEKDLHYMLSMLSDDELEVAARTSYYYLKNRDVEKRNFFAMRMAKRYLASKKDKELALQKMRATIAFRKSIDVDGLRETFEDPSSKYRCILEPRLEKQVNFVRGFDKAGRATHVFVASRSMIEDHCSEWTVKEAIYTMERAIACSKAEDCSVNAIIDLNGFSLVTNAPPLNIAKDFMTTLRSHYAGQVNKIFILDAPYGFSFLWKLVRPFVGTTTAEKIEFLSGAEKAAVISQWYSEDQSRLWSEPFDTKTYIHSMPFDKTCNDQENQSSLLNTISMVSGRIPVTA